MGIYFGALLPLVQLLSLKKALIWFVICFITFSLLYIKIKHLSLVDHSLNTKQAISKLILFGLIWSLFPFIACSAISFTGDSSKNCLCEEIPPVVEVKFRKHGNILQITNNEAIREIIQRTKKHKPIEVTYTHPGEMERLFTNLEARKETREVSELLADLKKQESEITIGLYRLISMYTKSPLPASTESMDFKNRIRYRLNNSQDIIILHGREALEALYSDIEREENYLPEVEALLESAVSKYLVTSLMDYYGFIRRVRNEDAENIDPDFIDFLLDIPDFKKIIKQVVYPNKSETNLIAVECGSNNGLMGSPASSRFFVSKKDIIRPELIKTMSVNYWTLTPPSKYFSESWWLEHAIWQMLGRLPGHAKENLPLRLDSYYICGVP